MTSMTNAHSLIDTRTYLNLHRSQFFSKTDLYTTRILDGAYTAISQELDFKLEHLHCHQSPREKLLMKHLLLLYCTYYFSVPFDWQHRNSFALRENTRKKIW